MSDGTCSSFDFRSLCLRRKCQPLYLCAVREVLVVQFWILNCKASIKYWRERPHITWYDRFFNAGPACQTDLALLAYPATLIGFFCRVCLTEILRIWLPPCACYTSATLLALKMLCKEHKLKSSFCVIFSFPVTSFTLSPITSLSLCSYFQTVYFLQSKILSSASVL